MGERIGFVGKGDVYMRIWDTAANGWKPWYSTGMTGKFEIKAEAEQMSQVSTGRDDFGQLVDIVSTPKEATISIEWKRPDRKVMAAMFLGSDSVVTVAGGDATDEAHTCPVLGGSILLDNGNISAVSITQGVTPLVLNTDYIISDAIAGVIEFLPTSVTATPGEALTIDYTYAARSGYKVSGVTNPQFKVQIRLDGNNRVDDSKVLVDVWMATIKPSGGWDFLGSDYAVAAFDGTLETPSGKTSPFEVFMAA